MTPSTNDLVDLAEAVAEGAMSQADAEARLRSDAEIDSASISELGSLVAALTAVTAHRDAFRNGLAGEPFANGGPAHGPTPIAVAAGAVRRRPGAPRSGNPRRTLLLVAAVLLLGVAAGGVMVAGGLTRSPLPTSLVRPAVVPSTGTPAPTAPSTTAPNEASTDWKALGDPFVVSTRRDPSATDFAHRYADWVARPDGSQATKLDGAWQMAWSRDGRRLLVAMADGELYFADVADSVGPLVDSGLSTHPDKGCPRKVGGRTTCQHQWFDLSPDGRNVAFVQQPNHHPGSYGVSTMDLTTGRIAVLEATLSRDSRPIEGVRWSPDGSKLVYSRTDDLGVVGRGGSPRTDLLIIDADGLNRHRLDLQGISASAPDWSPDGQTIAFASDIWRTDAEHESDIYTIGADGTSMRRLSTDGDRYQPAWLSDGRILYWSGDRFWIMTANGEDASPLPLLAGLDRPISGTGLPWSGLRVQPRP
jgi:dipeptidyl aminopeptidase/acylaminoacyl peptidase